MIKYLHLFLLLALSPSLLFSQTTFSDVSDSLGLQHICEVNEMGGGAAFLDINNDGWEDIYITGGHRMDALYLNNMNGTFTEITLSAGLGFTDSVATIGIVAGDIDNNAYPESFLTTELGAPNILLKNNGNNTFSDMSHTAGVLGDSLWSYSATFGDYNKDGYLDLYVGNYVTIPIFVYDSMNNVIAFDHDCASNYFYVNNGNNTFTEIISTLGIADTACNLATAFTDFDNDNDVDIMNANDFGLWIQPNELFQNNYPNNSFTDISTVSNAAARMFGMGIAIGDYDQDMDLDYYITNIGRNVLLRNNSNLTFTDSTNAAGVEDEFIPTDTTLATGWGTGFFDIDNDSYRDLFVANSYIEMNLPMSLLDPDKLFHNNGDGTFTEISAAAGVNNPAKSRGFAYGDYDNDGDIDMLVIPIIALQSTDTTSILLYRNELNNTNQYLKVNLQGTVSNREAIGAHIRIHVGGQSWLYEVSPSGSHASDY